MIAYFVLFTFPFFIPTVIGGIVATVRKSYVPAIVGLIVGAALETVWYVGVISQMVVQ